MSQDRAKPAAVLMDMLRGAPEVGRNAAYLINIGRLFNFSENTVRVTLSRLVARGLLENPQRGSYRLAATTDPINEFVERWRLGEARVSPWQPGRWLIAHAETLPERAGWALNAFGFREVRQQLFARPDNLAESLDEAREQARGIGVSTDILIMQTSLAAPHTDGWMDAWKIPQLNHDYQTLTQQLQQSQARLSTLPVDAARLECFKLGGIGIHRLAKDPLLPAQFVDVQGVDVQARRALHATMISYDAAGKAIWANSRREKDNSLPIPRLARVG